MAEDTIRAALQAGMRLQVTRTVNDVGNMDEERFEELKKLVERYRNRYDLITLNIGIHGLYTTGKETVKKLVEYSKETELPIHMHFCENQKEVDDIKRNYSVGSPAEALEDYFANTHMILAHGVKLTDEDIKTISRMRANVVHCPVSNLRLGCRSFKSTKNGR